jgi:transposase
LAISRRTISNWLISVAKKCHVLDKLLWESVTSSGAIQMDETFFQVMREEGRKNQTKSYMWVMRSIPKESRVVYFAYHPTRASAVPRTLLSGYKGVVQTDGYKGYDFLERLDGIDLVACWAHVRRKFHDACKASGSKGKKGKKSRKLSYAERMLGLIRQLYAVEKSARESELAPAAWAELRAQHSKPILAMIKKSLDEHACLFPNQSLTGNAILYTLRLWPRLTHYADTGIVPIDNNAVENVIRPFVIGRKNWLFAGSPTGAKALATLFSLIETAKINQWEPYTYLRYLFDHLPNAVGEDELRRLLPHIAQPIPTSVYVGDDREAFREHLTSEPALL